MNFELEIFNKIYTCDTQEVSELREWYRKQQEFDTKHPRCMSCGRFLRKYIGASCPNCDDYRDWY